MLWWVEDQLSKLGTLVRILAVMVTKEAEISMSYLSLPTGASHSVIPSMPVVSPCVIGRRAQLRPVGQA